MKFAVNTNTLRSASNLGMSWHEELESNAQIEVVAS